ncbi:MAG: PilZ domain-containing protein [Deltaproteobacteria bacterium]|nr:MAG: PilZ domain-containing protein [Deltaproteobacteria bacterium]
MSLNRWAELHAEQGVSSKDASREQTGVPPWIFKHQDLFRVLKSAESLSQKHLINIVNRIHFKEGSILVHLKHPKYGESVLVRAYPQACFSGNLTCRWSERNPLISEILRYQFLHLLIANGKSIILVPGELQNIDEEFLRVQLPKESYAIGQRQARRYACKEVTAQLTQNGFCAKGELLDFSPLGLRMKVTPESHSSFHWLNSDELVSMLLRHGKQILFSGPCSFIREQGSFHEREFVLVPTEKMIKRFKRKQIRNPRLRLLPSPTVTFDHPFSQERFQLEVRDVSTSGFSVYETSDESVLIPGIILPGLSINFASELKLNCTAQVIYREDKKTDGIHCGLAILDMDINAYSLLTHIVTKALDPHAHLSDAVDMDALWEFFFESGFIYPTKYRLMQSHREEFKETYRKLYQENPRIAKHFTYEQKGKIYGHISMVRAYQRSWMIHHYAARSMQKRRTGFMVLKQMMHYLNDMCRLPSAKMDYVICYFRPENKFPKLVFGGFARALNNKRGCSTDLFAYLPYTTLSLGTELPKGWSLKECSEQDLWELRRFYAHYSGGLLLDALGIDQEESGEGRLDFVYGSMGFYRKWKAYSLSRQGELGAVLIVDQSDLGLNFSELLNGIKILVTRPEALPWNVLSTAVAKLTAGYDMEKVPILFYPFEYVQAADIPYEKRYQLWILNVRYGQEYMEFMHRKFKIGYE